MKSLVFPVVVVSFFVACGGSSGTSTSTSTGHGGAAATTSSASASGSSGTGAAGGAASSASASTGGSGAGTGGAATSSASSSGGLCTGVVCKPTDSCHAAGTCDPMTVMCSNPVRPDGSACATCLGTATCQAGMCTGGVDQSQLLSPVVLKAYGEELRQTFTIGKTGVLTGIELSLCNVVAAPSGGAYRLDFYHNGVLLDAPEISADAIGSACAPLGATSIGSGFFPLCESVSAGQSFDFVIYLSNVSAPSCGPSQHCDIGDVGAPCPVPGPDPVHCSYQTGVAGTHGDVYAGGSLSINGVTGMGDLAFKTFVQ